MMSQVRGRSLKVGPFASSECLSAEPCLRPGLMLGSCMNKVPSWLADLRLHADPSVVIILVGNKADLVESSPTSDDSPSSTSASDSPPQDSTSSSAPSSLTSATSDPNREVSRQEAQEFARREGLLFLETSAKTGQGINEVRFDQSLDAREVHSTKETNEDIDMFDSSKFRPSIRRLDRFWPRFKRGSSN